MELRSNKNQFCFLFVICCLQYAFIQLVLPHLLPGLFESGGLLKLSKDSIDFHELAILKAKEIHQFGWSAWVLKPKGQAPSGVASILYYFVPSLWMTIPLCAALQSFAALSLGKIIRELNFSLKAAKWISFLFVIHPISLQWNSQHHKDCYAVLGIMLFILGFIRIHKSTSMKEAFIAFCKYSLMGIILILFARSYLLEILAVAFILTTTFTIIISRQKIFQKLSILLMLIFGFSLMSFQPNTNQFAKGYNLVPIEMNWEPSPYIPQMLDTKLEAFAKNRKTFIQEIGNRNTTLKTGFDLHSSADVFLFLPQVFLDSLIQPIPFAYTHKTQTMGSYIMGIVASFDMIISYVFLIFLAVFLILNRKRLILMQVCLVLFILMTIFAFSFPNLGTLYRMRYPFYIILIAMGFAYAFDLFKAKFTSSQGRQII